MSHPLQQEAGQLTSTVAEAEQEKLEICCPVCLDDCKKSKSIKLSACGHSLCKDCARTLVLKTIRYPRSGTIPILCPVCLAEPGKCQKCMHLKESMLPRVIKPSAWSIFAPLSLDFWLGFYSGSQTSAPAADSVQRCAYGVDYWCGSLDADVRQLLSTREWEEYSRRSLQAAVAKGGDLLACPQTDCPGIAVRGNKEDGAVCNECGYCWCLDCGDAWHALNTCEAVAERHFTSYKALWVVKRCSSCGHGLEKISGCDHVTCAGCRRYCSYSTLARAV